MRDGVLILGAHFSDKMNYCCWSILIEWRFVLVDVKNSLTDQPDSLLLADSGKMKIYPGSYEDLFWRVFCFYEDLFWYIWRPSWFIEEEAIKMNYWIRRDLKSWFPWVQIKEDWWLIFPEDLLDIKEEILVRRGANQAVPGEDTRLVVNRIWYRMQPVHHGGFQFVF